MTQAKRPNPSNTVDYVKEKFINFFKKHGHEYLDQSPLVCTRDTLFTVAGMQQFSEVFTGKRERTHPRVVTAQNCLRLSGKHNDYNEIGRTLRHNTLFTMLGNFSFFDYGKTTAIELAYKFLTEELELDPRYLYFSVYDSDHESYRICESFLKGKTARSDSNLWEAGDLGPFGPCAEIFFDRKLSKEPRLSNFEQQLKNNQGEEEEFLEIWNIVFMQYERYISGGKIEQKALKSIAVDTGAGLERLASIVSRTFDNFKTDYLKESAALARSFFGKEDRLIEYKARLLADHSRAVAFLLKEKVFPSPDQQGAVLRKLIRRMLLTLRGCSKLENIIKIVVFSAEQYGLIVENQDRSLIESVLTEEIEGFKEVLERTDQLKEKLKENLKEGLESKMVETIQYFYRTHGIPLEIAEEILHQEGLKLDLSSIKVTEESKKVLVREETKPAYYDFLEIETEVVYVDNKAFVTKESCFYPRGGGQKGDEGTFEIKGKKGKVLQTWKENLFHGIAIFHEYQFDGKINTGDRILLKVDESVRKARTRAHSAAHLSCDSLIRSGYDQAGSSVDSDAFHIDLVSESLFERSLLEDLIKITNKVIRDNIEVIIEEKDFEEVKGLKTTAKEYGNRVRVVKIGPSEQLCGGTHVKRTGDIGLFLFTGQKKIKKSVCRLFGITGKRAVEFVLERAFGHSVEKKKEEEEFSNPTFQLVGPYSICFIEKSNEKKALKELDRGSKIVIFNENASTRIVTKEERLAKILREKFSMVGGGRETIFLGSKHTISFEEIGFVLKSSLIKE